MSRRDRDGFRWKANQPAIAAAVRGRGRSRRKSVHGIEHGRARAPLGYGIADLTQRSRLAVFCGKNDDALVWVVSPSNLLEERCDHRYRCKSDRRHRLAAPDWRIEEVE